MQYVFSPLVLWVYLGFFFWPWDLNPLIFVRPPIKLTTLEWKISNESCPKKVTEIWCTDGQYFRLINGKFSFLLLLNAVGAIFRLSESNSDTAGNPLHGVSFKRVPRIKFATVVKYNLLKNMNKLQYENGNILHFVPLVRRLTRTWHAGKE